MTHDDIRDLLPVYAVGAGDPGAATGVTAHLRQCPQCAAELARLHETLAALAADAPAPPPPDLRARVLAAAAATPQVGRHAAAPEEVPADVAAAEARAEAAVAGEAAEPVAVPRDATDGANPARSLRVPRRAAWSLLGLAAAAALFLAGVLAAPLVRPDGQAQPGPLAADLLTEPDTRLVEASPQLPAELAGDAAGDVVVVVSGDTDEGVLLASGLPAAPQGRAWQVWYLVPGEGDTPQPRSAGLLPADERLVLSPPARTQAIAVSLEPAAGSEAPTTTPVAVLSVA